MLHVASTNGAVMAGNALKLFPRFSAGAAG